MCKIVEFQAENVKRLSAVHIKPDGALMVIGGRCDQGKSSVLDSIMYALAGGKSLPAIPLRRGAKKGRVKLDLGELTVERTFTEKGSTLEVKSKDGYDAPTPQKILDDMCGKLAFDPLEFMRQKPKDQLTVMRDMVGIDFTELDERRAAAFATRTNINRDVKQLDGELKGAAHFPDAPEVEVSVAELSDELERIRRLNAANEKQRDRVAPMSRDVATEQAAIERDTAAVVEQEAKLANMRRALAAREASLVVHRQERDEFVSKVSQMADADPSSVRQKMSAAESTNSKVRQNAKREEISGRLETAKARSQELTDEITAIDAEKQATVSAAKFPVDGLGFGEDGITFNGLPFEQASGSQRLRVSVAMGLSSNPKLRVMLIREGSFLDEEALALLGEMAEAADAQVWVERVSRGSEVSVIIEDGEIKRAEIAETEEAVQAAQ